MDPWNPSRSLSARIVYALLAASLASSVAVTLWCASTAQGPWALSTGQMLGLNAAAAMAFGLLGRRIAASIVKPIEAVTRAATRIGKGESYVAIPHTHARDEPGALTHSFRDMTRTLADTHRLLEASQQRVVETNEQLVSQNDQLCEANEILERLSITDGLTRLHNHRFFQDSLIREAKRADRTGEPLALILADIDHFKQWNDRLGHAGGDEILRRLCKVMNSVVRETDLLARYGGEEFAILLPNTELDGAVALAQKIRTSVSEAPLLLNPPSERQPVTLSLGVAAYAGDRKKMFNDADRALYLAKDSGRDCVLAAEPDSNL